MHSREATAMATYLIFGDLHGRVLPAFALARAWQGDHGEPLDALLQVGDLGYYPDHSRLDKATKRHAQRDPLELGAAAVIRDDREAQEFFARPGVPGPMWFVAGNHEDHERLLDRYGLPGSTDDDFPADDAGRLRCVVSGRVASVRGGLRVGGLWGIDDEAPGCRRNVSRWMRLEPRRAKELAMRPMDVLLTHESPRDSMILDSGSEHINLVLDQARPRFAFFGHYHGEGRIEECDLGVTQAFHLAGMEFRGKGGSAEERCAGVLRWGGGRGEFEYLDPKWLRTITRHNWMTR
jgi:hypothetical protein